MTFLTIGHSNRSLEDFLALLTDSGVGLVVDVRKLAGSNKFPWFNAEPLTSSLTERDINYERIESLTGRRPKSRTVPPETNALWRNQSFHNYADYALSADFEEGFTRLIETASLSRPQATGTHVAIMCAEAVWWRCHRRIIADHLIARGEQVAHVINGPDPSPASLTLGALVAAGSVTYPQAQPVQTRDD